MTGYWSTDAPLGGDQTQDHRRRLANLLDLLEIAREGIVIRSLTVWVDGVEWTYAHVETLR